MRRKTCNRFQTGISLALGSYFFIMFSSFRCAIAEEPTRRNGKTERFLQELETPSSAVSSNFSSSLAPTTVHSSQGSSFFSEVPTNTESILPSSNDDNQSTTSAMPSASSTPTSFSNNSNNTQMPSDVPSIRPSETPSSIPSLLPSSIPSTNPTEEPNCTSTTDGPLDFERYIAIRIAESENIKDYNAFLRDLETAILISYQDTINCPQKGSFRQLYSANFVYENRAAATSTGSREYIFGLHGTCEGCNPHSLWLFNETATYYDLDEVENNDFNWISSRRKRSLLQEVETCFCSIPRQSMFEEALVGNLVNMALIAPPSPATSLSSANATTSVLEEYGAFLPIEVVELVPDYVSPYSGDECDVGSSPDIANGEQSEESFTTTVVVRFVGDDDLSFSDDQLNLLAAGFRDAYTSESALTKGNCDLQNHVIVSVQAEMMDTIVGNRRQLNQDNNNINSKPNLRKRSSSSSSGSFVPGLFTRQLEADYAAGAEHVDTTAVLFTVSGYCSGCEGLLFDHPELEQIEEDGDKEDIFDDFVVGNVTSNTTLSPSSSPTSSPACFFCPVDTNQYGLNTDYFRAPLRAQLSETLNMANLQVDEVVEVDPFSCMVEPGTFKAYAIVEVNVDVNSTTGPLQGELDALEIAFVTSYNRLARNYCDPYRRRLKEATIVGMSEEGLSGEAPLALELEVSGTCFDCDDNITLYDSVSFLTGISVGPGRRLNRDQVDAGNDSFAKSVDSVVLPNRNQRDVQEEVTCYCDVNSIPDQGATEPEVVDAFSSLVSTLNLPNIDSVEDCKFLTLFQSSVILRFTGAPENATEEELNALGQGFIDAYNRISSGDQVCDRQFRKLVDFRLDANITVNDEFLEGLGDGGDGGDGEEDMAAVDEQGRRVLTWNKIERRQQRQRHLQGAEVGNTNPSATSAPTTAFGYDNSASTEIISNAPTFLPSAFGFDSNNPSSSTTTVSASTPTSAPTSVFIIGTSSPSQYPTIQQGPNSIDVLLQVAGTCRGCANNFALFDQVSSARRKLQQPAEVATDSDSDTGEIQLDFLTVTGSCFCPPEAVQAEPSEELVIEAFEETVEELREEGVVNFVEEVEEIEEVTVVQCVLETNAFETTLIIDFYAYFDLIGSGDVDAIRVSFNSTYNRLSEDYCDALFRRSEDVTSIQYERMSAPDNAGISRVRFYLTVEGRCHGCSDGEPVLLTGGGSTSRFLDEDDDDDDSDLCFCGSNKVAERAPTEEEFESMYRESWRQFRRYRGRELKSNALVELASIGDETLSPTTSPSAVPSAVPSNLPTTTFQPSSVPTASSSKPSSMPSIFPTTTSMPSQEPTALASQGPSSLPSTFPSLSPSDFPSMFPSEMPSELPSSFPSESPSIAPSTAPSVAPSVQPSAQPSSQPSTVPTPGPTLPPTRSPTTSPTLSPTTSPTRSPTTSPTLSPTTSPTRSPTLPPTRSPTTSPTLSPTTSPTHPPTIPPTASPTPAPVWRVFVTSTKYTGALGGLAGADDKCQQAADDAGLGGTWYAWVSVTAGDPDGPESPDGRFHKSAYAYVMVGTGAKIANDWNDLVDGTLINQPKTDENGNPNENVRPWTGTRNDGTGPVTPNCQDFTSDSSNANSQNGSNVEPQKIMWSKRGLKPCDTTHALYCFEQP